MFSNAFKEWTWAGLVRIDEDDKQIHAYTIPERGLVESVGSEVSSNVLSILSGAGNTKAVLGENKHWTTPQQDNSTQGLLATETFARQDKSPL